MSPMHFNSDFEEKPLKTSSLTSVIHLDLQLFTGSDDRTRHWNDIFT